jgi:hypothetical protein
MRGSFGVILGIVLITIGLAGLGVALHEMMSHADPHTTIKAAGGLAVFVAMGLVTAILAN